MRRQAKIGSVATLAIAGFTIAIVVERVQSVAAHDPIRTRVTWAGEVEPIVRARCVTCHAPDGRGPMSLATYEDARPWARAIKEEVMTRRMPKWHAVRGYGDFSNDPSLSPFEIAVIAAWADGGAPRGTDADVRALATAAPANTASPDSREATIHSRQAIIHSRQATIHSRQSIMQCGERPAPAGVLVALQPKVAPHGSAGIAVRFPDGRREIVAWIRDYDPEFPTVYQLREPLALPAGSTIITEAEGPATGLGAGACTVTLTVAERR